MRLEVAKVWSWKQGNIGWTKNWSVEACEQCVLRAKIGSVWANISLSSVNGTTGESLSLTVEERKLLTEEWIQAAIGRWVGFVWYSSQIWNLASAGNSAPVLSCWWSYLHVRAAQTRAPHQLLSDLRIYQYLAFLLFAPYPQTWNKNAPIYTCFSCCSLSVSMVTGSRWLCMLAVRT